MNLSAALIRRLQALGIDGELLAGVCEAVEVSAGPAPVADGAGRVYSPSAGAARTRAYRARKAALARASQSVTHVTDVTPRDAGATSSVKAQDIANSSSSVENLNQNMKAESVTSRHHSVTDVTDVTVVEQKRKVSPTPPLKKKQTSSQKRVSPRSQRDAGDGLDPLDVKSVRIELGSPIARELEAMEGKPFGVGMAYWYATPRQVSEAERRLAGKVTVLHPTRDPPKARDVG